MSFSFLSMSVFVCVCAVFLLFFFFFFFFLQDQSLKQTVISFEDFLLNEPNAVRFV